MTRTHDDSTASRRAFLVGAAALAATGSACARRETGETATRCPPEDETTTGASPSASPTAARTPLRVLVLGGTGFLGPHLVEIARARGHAVTLFNRGKTRPELFPELEKLRGDRDSDVSVLKGREFDVVLDTSGYIPRQVAIVTDALGEVGSYVFVSSISVYVESAAAIDESSAVQALDDPASEDVMRDYGALKAACERAAESARPGRVLAVRPGLIVGPGDPTDRFTYWPVRVARGGEVLAPGRPTDPVQWIDVRDLARLCVTAGEAKATGQVNAVCDPTPMETLLASCQRSTGSSATLRWVSAAALEALQVAPWSDMPVWIPSDSTAAGMAQIANARARSLGLETRHVDDTTAATWAWWRTLPTDRQKLRAGLAADRELAVLRDAAAAAG